MSTDGNVVAGHIMKEGDRGTEMWIIVDGSVRVESVARKGDTGKPVGPAGPAAVQRDLQQHSTT